MIQEESSREHEDTLLQMEQMERTKPSPLISAHLTGADWSPNQDKQLGLPETQHRERADFNQYAPAAGEDQN